MTRLLLAVIALVPALLLLLPVFAVGLPVLLFAVAVRALGRRFEPRVVPWRELVTFDPVLGWKPRPALDAHYLAEYDDVFRVVTDDEGWPGRRSLDDSEVVVIGDSFAFGYGIDTDRSFAEVNPRLPSKAVGAPGYSMVQGVLLMEQLGRRLARKLVVWMVYLENDFQDNLSPELRGYRAPFVRRRVGADWEIAGAHVTAAAWTCSDLDRRRLFPKLCVPGVLADRAFSACDYLIGRAATGCSAVDARLVIVTVPHPLQLTRPGMQELSRLSGMPQSCDVNLPDAQLAACCARHGVALVAGKAHLATSDFKHREGIHWNEQGHRRMAELLLSLYEAFRAGDLDARVPPPFAAAPAISS
jgi:hypothetical protein